MSKPLFKNEKPYNVAVPTPYGSSVNVPPGKYVAGNYYNKFYTFNTELKLQPEGTVPPNGSVICTYEVGTRSAPAPVPEVVNTEEVINLDTIPARAPEQEVSPSIAEPSKKKGGRPKKNLEEATKDLWKDVTFVLPASGEVDKLSSEDLTKLANKLNVSKTLSRTEMIETIKLKLG